MDLSLFLSPFRPDLHPVKVEGVRMREKLQRKKEHSGLKIPIWSENLVFLHSSTVVLLKGKEEKDKTWLLL